MSLKILTRTNFINIAETSQKSPLFCQKLAQKHQFWRNEKIMNDHYSISILDTFQKTSLQTLASF